MYIGSDAYKEAQRKYNASDKGKATRARRKLWLKTPEGKAQRKAWYNKYIASKQGSDKIREANYRKYGISLEEYDLLLQKQNGRCAICWTTIPRGNGRFHVDHNHTTGKIRGLLCHSCNASLGGFQDSADILLKAVKYLEDTGG